MFLRCRYIHTHMHTNEWVYTYEKKYTEILPTAATSHTVNEPKSNFVLVHVSNNEILHVQAHTHTILHNCVHMPRFILYPYTATHILCYFFVFVFSMLSTVPVVLIGNAVLLLFILFSLFVVVSFNFSLFRIAVYSFGFVVSLLLFFFFFLLLLICFLGNSLLVSLFVKLKKQTHPYMQYVYIFHSVSYTVGLYWNSSSSFLALFQDFFVRKYIHTYTFMYWNNVYVLWMWKHD